MQCSDSEKNREQCSVLAFYGVDGTESGIENFYECVMRWFGKLNCPPHKISVRGPSHSGSTMPFIRASRLLQRDGFSGVTDISVYSLLPHAQIPMNDYTMAASYSVRTSHACVVVRSSVAQLTHDMLMPLAIQISNASSPAYGIGFTREDRLGPLMYVVGLAQGLGIVGPENDEATAISKWCYIGMVNRVYLRGMLRDIYPWNFLTRQHLEFQINGLTLEEWICQDVRRGFLRPATHNLTVWDVQGADLHTIRSHLLSGGMIFDWRISQ